MKKVPPPKNNARKPPPPKLPRPPTGFNQSIARQQHQNTGQTQQTINQVPQQNSQNPMQNLKNATVQIPQLDNTNFLDGKNQDIGHGNAESTQPQNLEYQQSEQLQQVTKIPQRQPAKPKPNRSPIPTLAKRVQIQKKMGISPPIPTKKPSLSIDIEPATHTQETKSKTGSQKIKGINPSVKKQVPLPQTPQRKQQQESTIKQASSVYSRLQDKLNKLSNARQQLQMSDSQGQAQSDRQVMSQPNANQRFQQQQQQDNSEKESEQQVDEFNANQKTNQVQVNEQQDQAQVFQNQYQHKQKQVPNFYFDEDQPVGHQHVTQYQVQENGQQQQSKFEPNFYSNEQNEQISIIPNQSPIKQPIKQQEMLPNVLGSQNLNIKPNSHITNQNVNLSNSVTKRNDKLQKYQPQHPIQQQPSQQLNQSLEKNQSGLKRSQTRNIPVPKKIEDNVPVKFKLDDKIKVQGQQTLDDLIGSFNKVKKQYSQNMLNFKRVSQNFSRQEDRKVNKIKLLMGQLKQKDEQIRNILMQY